MMNEEMTLERLRQFINEIHQKGEKGLLIWKNSEERDKCGENEKDMWVQDAFEVYGYTQEGKAYGNYRDMELSRAIRNAFECGQQLKVSTDGKTVSAMVFQIEEMLSNEGHLMFACRGMLYGHLNGPIVSIPSYQVFELKR